MTPRSNRGNNRPLAITNQPMQNPYPPAPSHPSVGTGIEPETKIIRLRQATLRYQQFTGIPLKILAPNSAILLPMPISLPFGCHWSFVNGYCYPMCGIRRLEAEDWVVEFPNGNYQVFNEEQAMLLFELVNF